jgi:2-(1,2-epoxy-1,2-dihydrophenyl)acetyl-CoA isomerase
MSTTLESHDPDIRSERDAHFATVTIDHSNSKNAFTGDMWVAVGATFRDLSWSGIRCLCETLTADMERRQTEFQGR